ncbi:MAG: RluA family pseudouridine synthase [Oscillospiraceae bacterium]|jgi:23S rRNA pseudouridine1911/1915/1917 synthase|nr:RluA family pseudouridine synthase [Oscillospiraceae bacterium]
MKITVDTTGQRLDKWLSENSGLLQDSGQTGKNTEMTRSALQKLIGNVLVNGIQTVKSHKLKAGDVVEVSLPKPVEMSAEPENIPLEIVYEDGDLLVVNKPKGMVVHPAAGNYTGTLVNALLYHCKGRLSAINGVIRPGIVHRIDKDTSGLLIVAKNDSSHRGLAEQIKQHSFTREYEAVALGRFRECAGSINAPIGRHSTDRKKMCVTLKNSKEAVTHYEVIEEIGKYTYLRLKLETGRTHQIRVHLAYIGHPILGDTVYGNSGSADKGTNGQCLHARKIGFVHPASGGYMEFVSELPEYFKDVLKKYQIH